MDDAKEGSPHPADETKSELLVHGWLPAAVSIVILAISISADLVAPGPHWTQRSGSIVTVLGAYVAYRDATRSIKFIGNDMYMNFELPYRPISVAMVVIGTLIWGYADLVL